MERDWTGILLLIAFIGIIGFVMWDIFHTKGGQLTAFTLPIILICIIWYWEYGAWFLRLKGKQFITSTGLVGTVLSEGEARDQDRVRYVVSFRKGYFSPEERRKLRVVDRMSAFEEAISGTFKAEIVAPASHFLNLPSQNSEAPEGCVLFLGGLKGIEPVKTEQLLLYENESLRRNLSYLNTIRSHEQQQLRQLVEEYEMIDSNVAQKLKTKLEGIVRPNINVYNPTGGGAQPPGQQQFGR